MSWWSWLRPRFVGSVIILLVVTFGLRPYAPWTQAFAVAGGVWLSIVVGYIWGFVIWPETIDGWTRGIWTVGLAVVFLTILTFALSWVGVPIKPITLVGQNLVVGGIGAWLIRRRIHRQRLKT